MDMKLTLVIVTLFYSFSALSAQLKPCQTEECKSYFNQYKKSASRGHAQASAMLGEFYYHGYGVEKNSSNALRYYLFAAKRGITSAQYKAGLAFLIDGKHKDTDKAIKYLHKAASKKYKDASYLLGRVYLTDEFGHKDIDKADFYLSQAYGLKHADMPNTLIFISQKYTSDFELKFPLLDKAYSKQPLEMRNDKLVWFNTKDVEVITITGNKLETLFDAQLVSYKRKKASLGSRLRGQSCARTVGCQTMNIQGLADLL